MTDRTKTTQVDQNREDDGQLAHRNIWHTDFEVHEPSWNAGYETAMRDAREAYARTQAGTPIPEAAGECWLYAGYKNPKGYGETSVWVNGKTRGYSVHRLMYEAYNGKIPDGFQLDHLCGVSSCIRPAHLEAVTPAENHRRSRINLLRKTHCNRGHGYTEDNTYTYPSGARECRKCRWARMKEYRHEQIRT